MSPRFLRVAQPKLFFRFSLSPETQRMRVAMIGIKAIPARFGGFETAADEISRGLVRLGYNVWVYNRSGMSPIPRSSYEGVDLVTLPTVKSKNLSTIVHV